MAKRHSARQVTLDDVTEQLEFDHLTSPTPEQLTAVRDKDIGKLAPTPDQLKSWLEDLNKGDKSLLRNATYFDQRWNEFVSELPKVDTRLSELAKVDTSRLAEISDPRIEKLTKLWSAILTLPVPNIGYASIDKLREANASLAPHLPPGMVRVSRSTLANLQKAQASAEPPKPIDPLVAHFDELNELWSEAEKELATYRVPHTIYVEVNEHDIPGGHGTESDALVWIKRGGEWRICWGPSRNPDYEEGSWDIKPISECSMEERVRAVEAFPLLQSKAREARTAYIPKVAAAVDKLRAALKSQKP